MVKTVVIVSGGGAALQPLLDARLFGEIENCDITAVISSNPEAYALERAKTAGVPTSVVDRTLFPNNASFCEAVMRQLIDLDADLVVLAGFAHPIHFTLAREFKNRMISVYPSLLPAFSDEGLYGEGVYDAALKMGVRITGATAHFISEDGGIGPIILQKAVDVKPDDTAKSLCERVMEQAELPLLLYAVKLFCEGRIAVDGEAVRILPKE